MLITSKTSVEQSEADPGSVALSLARTESASLEPTTNRLRLVPHIDHKPPPDDDCGMPPHPISGDYVKDLWRSHTRSGGVPSLIRSRKRVGGRNDCEKLTAD
jgi:hypothetical protein